MPISTWLQHHFDNQDDYEKISQKLDNISDDISPEFIHSFNNFRLRILGVMEENSEVSKIIWDEVDQLGIQLHNARRRHNLQKSATIIEKTER